MGQLRERAWRSVPLPARRAAQRTWAGYTRLTSGWRLLPDYLIIGTQRGGTTSLYKYLAGHPGHPHALSKELRFFDSNYRRGMAWYRSRFPSRAYRALARRVRGYDIVVGEASPDYLFHPRVPARVARDLPWARFVVLLRNPVDRAWSHYWHQAKRGFERLTFEEAIDREGDRLHGELDRMLRDERYESFERHHHSYLARGVYADQLDVWLELFPPARFHFERSEDLFAAPAATSRRVAEFLGLPPVELGSYHVYNVFAEGSMHPATRSRLVDYFRPHNLRLYELLGRDFGWDA
jgi:hypothetical protein